MEREFQDWEMLHNSHTDSVDLHQSDEKSRNFHEIDGGSEGMIRSDYFSVDYMNKESGRTSDVSEERPVESYSSCWVDPGSEGKNSDEVLFDSSVDPSDELQFGDLGDRSELGFVDSANREKGCETCGEMESKTENLDEFVPNESKLRDFEADFTENAKNQRVCDGDLDKRCSDLGEQKLVYFESGDVEKETEMNLVDNIKKGDELGISSQSSMEAIEGTGGNSIGHEAAAVSSTAKSGGEGQGKSLVWWKMPFHLLKYCVYKAGPVWSVSVAAAVMGFVLLGRRLYNMKKKAGSLQLKVTLDDKKTSQAMSRAARLNEAFSAVRRVPVVRPALAAPGVNPWPVLSLR